MPSRRNALAGALLAAGLAAAGCRGGEAPPAAPVPSPEAAPRAKEAAYRPPASGVLTPEQVRAFVAAREKLTARVKAPGAAAAAPAQPGRIGFAELRQLELDAAREAGLGSEEYLWIKERVLEAEAADATAELNEASLAQLEKTLATLRSRRAAAADEPSRAVIDDQIRAFEAEAARTRTEAAEPEPPAVQANRKVVRAVHPRLVALRQELDQALPRPALPTPRP